MKILFANPPWWVSNTPLQLSSAEARSLTHAGVRCGSRWPFTLHGQSTPDHFRFGDYLPYPFFLGYAATYARKHLGVPVLLRDSIALRESYHSFFQYLQQQHFSHLVIESATPSWPHDQLLLQEIKRRHPDLRLLLTGPIASKGEEILASGLVHSIIRGEYEKGVTEAIAHDKEGMIDYALLSSAEMNSAPYPYYDDLLAHRYCDSNPRGQRFPQAQVWSSRGCPYKCIFCVWPATMTGNDPDGSGQRKVRHYTADYMEGMLRELVGRYRFQSIYFDDDTFNLGDRHVLAMCEVMQRIALPWSAMCRPDGIRASTWAAMKESGCFGVKLGIESGNQQVVDQIVNKKLDLEEARQTVLYLKQLGMSVHGTFTLGLPGESDAQREETRQFIRSLPFDSLQTSGCAEIEGTPLHTLAQTGVLPSYRGARLDAGYQRHADGAVKLAALNNADSAAESNLLSATTTESTPPPGNCLETILELDQRGDLQALLHYLQGQPYSEELTFALYRLLQEGRVRSAYVLAIVLQASGRQNPLYSLASAVGGELYGDAQATTNALQSLRQQAASLSEQQRPLLEQIVIPLLYNLLLTARSQQNNALIWLALRLLAAIIPSFLPEEARQEPLPASASSSIPSFSGRIHVLDPMFGFYGHHVAVNNAIRDYCQQQGWSSQFYISHLPTHGFTLPEDVQSLFWGVDPNRDLGGERNRLFFNDARHGLTIHATDRIIIHTLYDSILIGLYHWLCSLPELPAQLCLMLRFPPNLMLTIRNIPFWVEPLFALGLQLLNSLRPRVHFFVDSITLRDYYRQLAGIEATLLPISIDFSPFASLPALPAINDTAPTTVLFLGEARGEKGFILLPEAIRLVQQQCSEIIFDLHITNVNPQDQEIIESLRQIAHGVRLTENIRLYGEAYFRKIASADAVLIPYSPLSYTYRTSHIMVEALGCGAPVVVTGEGSWMEQFVRPLQPTPAVVMPEFSAQALAEAVLALHRRKRQYQEAARAIAAQIRAEHNLPRFMQLLLASPRTDHSTE
ncbi:radical SAM protein [Candidatus Magnetaquicoccus inordinatus]|uniref:radical SAM protein n=1 Tax=Candidatus Magnetaquicoccus inordinatus TaxID=2496818 RepID=UPI001D0DD7C6|nr:radical SAM protein [Candidatus Magnetaquicoccus inordinatus]